MSTPELRRERRRNMGAGQRETLDTRPRQAAGNVTEETLADGRIRQTVATGRYSADPALALRQRRLELLKLTG